MMLRRRKMMMLRRRRRTIPRPRPTLCASLRSRHALGHFRRATLCENLQGKCRGPDLRRTFSASLRSRNALQHFTKATLQYHFTRKFTGKRLQTKSKQNSRRKLYASLRSRNALGDLTRATLCGNLEEKCRGSDGALWGSTGLYTYRSNPSVWTHCLRNISKGSQKSWMDQQPVFKSLRNQTKEW